MHWSADGSWLYYRVQGEGDWEVWRRRPEGGPGGRYDQKLWMEGMRKAA